MKRLIFLLFFLNVLVLTTLASHFKAGEITVERVSGNHFNFTLTIYLDSLSLAANPSLDEDSATFHITAYDKEIASITVPRENPMVSIGNGTWKNTYIVRNYFLNPGTTYTISYFQDFRNKNILNINGGNNTDNVRFYVETRINFDPFQGLNSTPVLLNPPIDAAVSGQLFIHNPGAYDKEGDSISYQLVRPLQSVNNPVPNYVNPTEVANSGTFTIDPITGDMVWDVPVKPGRYNVAFYIIEWRNGTRQSIIERDMQIVVKESPNRPPVLGRNIDTCVVAGISFTQLIRATDPDKNWINLTTSNNPPQGVYALTYSPALFTLNNGTNPLPNPASGTFSWNIGCPHVREQPYQVEFKAEDVPNSPPPLADYQSLRITVNGPKPTGLTITPGSDNLLLTWDAYICSNAQKMEIYRRDCDSAAFTLTACDKGIPDNSGFVKVGEVPITTTTFNDTTRLKTGQRYCYVLVAQYPKPAGGASYPSDISCSGQLLDRPVLLNVTVDKTDTLNGKITVRWTEPINPPTPGPYGYVIYRAEGLTGTPAIAVDTITDLTVTSYTDSTINTAVNGYSYSVNFLYNNLQSLKGSSDTASSADLSGRPGNRKAILSWETQVPWEIDYYVVYRKDTSGTFLLRDTLFTSATAASYIDTGLVNKDTFCYYVKSVGHYCDVRLPDSLINLSQIVCVVPRDSTPPCPPVLFIKPIVCTGPQPQQNDLNWINDPSPKCNKDIKGYNLYYAQYEGDPLQFYKFIPGDTFYVDFKGNSLSGCYGVTAVNFFGRESAMSNRVCVDNCSYYALPNLITPNGDFLNDSFMPFPNPRNVERVDFSVYNRWGKLVYRSSDNIMLDWEGVSSNGDRLSDGIYYYYADVKYFRRLRKQDEVLKLKGWIQILNNNEGHSEK